MGKTRSKPSKISLKQVCLARLHGTPNEFKVAVWRAYNDLTITRQEAVTAINKYRNIWMAAGERK